MLVVKVALSQRAKALHLLLVQALLNLLVVSFHQAQLNLLVVLSHHQVALLAVALVVLLVPAHLHSILAIVHTKAITTL